jgi:hypothetical protein
MDTSRLQPEIPAEFVTIQGTRPTIDLLLLSFIFLHLQVGWLGLLV